MTKPTEIKCRLCGVSLPDCQGYFERVNPKGEVPMIVECRPSCGTVLTRDEAVLAAIV